MANPKEHARDRAEILLKQLGGLNWDDLSLRLKIAGKLNSSLEKAKAAAPEVNAGEWPAPIEIIDAGFELSQVLVDLGVIVDAASQIVAVLNASLASAAAKPIPGDLIPDNPAFGIGTAIATSDTEPPVILLAVHGAEESGSTVKPPTTP